MAGAEGPWDQTLERTEGVLAPCPSAMGAAWVPALGAAWRWLRGLSFPPRLHLPGDEAAKLVPFEYFKSLESFNRLLFPSASS